jgi:hypothetical protein
MQGGLFETEPHGVMVDAGPTKAEVDAPGKCPRCDIPFESGARVVWVDDAGAVPRYRAHFECAKLGDTLNGNQVLTPEGEESRYFAGTCGRCACSVTHITAIWIDAPAPPLTALMHDLCVKAGDKIMGIEMTEELMALHPSAKTIRTLVDQNLAAAAPAVYSRIEEAPAPEPEPNKKTNLKAI